MSADASLCNEMITNDFVDNLKNLSLSPSANGYSIIIKKLLIQLKCAAPKGLIANLPFAMALVDNLHRVVPIFDQKLLEDNENAHQTNLFLETLVGSFRDLCLLNLFVEIKSSYCLNTLFHKYVPLLKSSYFIDDHRHDRLVSCLFPIIIYSSVLISVNEDNLPADLLTNLLEFTKKHWQSTSRQSVIQDILTFMKVSTKAPALIPMIIRSEWPQACIQWLKTTGPRPSYNADFYICLILQKVARHDIGVHALNQLECIKAFDESREQMKRDHDEEEYANIHFIQCVTYALLVEADEIKQNSILADKLVCQVLDQLVSYIFQSAKEPAEIYRGCRISEILCILSKLFVNDDILNKCFRENKELFNCLARLLVDFASHDDSDTRRMYKMLKDEALITLANLFWSISFHPTYHDKFKSNVSLMQTLSNLATSSLLYFNPQVKTIPRDMVSLKKAAEGILWNLKSSHLTPSTHKIRQQPHIMISYSHNNSTFCQELVEHLSPYVPVWVDYQQASHHSNHSDDVWEEIAGAMEAAIAIISIVTKDYYDSKACRQELSYASDTLKKRILPVFAPDHQFKASGWLGIRIAGQKYVHFGRKTFTDAMNELLSLINIEPKSVITVETPRQTIKREKSIQIWTLEDIRKWFADNHIHPDLTTLFIDQFRTGTSLLVYAHHLRQFYRHEFMQTLAIYQNQFNGKRLSTMEFITFVDALWSLREKYHSEMRIEDVSCNGGTTWL